MSSLKSEISVEPNAARPFVISCQSISEVPFAIVLSCIALLLWQPDRAMLGRLYEEALERKKQQYGASDTRTIKRRATLACS